MNEIIELETNIEELIYEIRGKQVMLDSDLARLYKCKNGTKEINQAVKNNIEKFPERFSWILTDEESTDFLVKNFDQKRETRGGKYKNLEVIYDNTFHDRYFIIDNKEVYHCGTSINRIGHKTFSITLMNDEDITHPLINKIKILTHNKKSNKINM